MNSNERPPTDYRRLHKQTERRLLLAAVFFLVIVGGGLIGVVFGPVEMLASLPCLLSGAGLILGLFLLLVIIERWAN